MLKVCLLGERAITDADTGAGILRSQRALSLVAFLIAHAPVPQARSRIAAAFWPDSTEHQALTNLRRELHLVRRVPDLAASLLTTGTELAWTDGHRCTVDVRTFRTTHAGAVRAEAPEERIALGRAALAAYRGDFLPGNYDDWALEVRDALNRECADLCDLLVAAAASAGDRATALSAARRRVELQPLEEAGYRSLIELQVRFEDRAAAVSTYHHCASVLEHELGIAPDPSTRAALETVIPAPVLRQDVAPPPDLVGRREEFRQLQEAVGAALSGSSLMVLLRGEPGVGKSRMLTESCRMARAAGAIVLRAQCYSGSGRLALAPVATWLGEPALRSSLERLPSAWRAEVDRLLPRPSSRGRPDAQGGLADAWQRHRFFQGLGKAILGHGGPLTLVLDNLQWCDAETLDFLAFLAGEARTGLLVALAGRDRDLSDGGLYSRWLQRQRAAGVMRELELGTFAAEETAELARLLGHQSLSEDVIEELHAATGGFPLYVVEAARAGELDGLRRGAGMAPVLRTRFARLSPEAGEVAALAAAVGRDFDLPLLCAASDLTPEEVVRGIDELWRQRLVDEGRSGYDFSHDLLRETAYQQVSPPRRWLLHRRLARALELVNADRTDEVAAQLADQYARAADPQRAFTHYRRAADTARGLFAHTEAIGHNRAALRQLSELPAGPDRERMEMAALRSLAASLNARRGYADPELADTWGRLVDLAEALGDRDSLVESLVGLWATRFVQGGHRLARTLVHQALELTEDPEGRSWLRPQANLAFGGSALHSGAPEVAVEHLDQACDQAGDRVSLIIGSHPVVHARAWAAHAHWSTGDTGAAAACARESLRRARTLGHPYDVAIALGYGAVTWQLLGERSRLLAATDELEALSRRYGFAYYADWGVVLSGWAAGGDLGSGRIRQGLAGLRAINAFARMPYWLSLLADVLVDEERAGAVLDAALATAHAQGDRWSLGHVLARRPAGRAPRRTLGERSLP